MFLSFINISYKFLRSIILKTIWLLTPLTIIHQIIPIAIISFFISFFYGIRFSQMRWNPVFIKSHTSFLIIIDFEIIDSIIEYVKWVSFSCLTLLEFNFFDIMMVINPINMTLIIESFLRNFWPRKILALYKEGFAAVIRGIFRKFWIYAEIFWNEAIISTWNLTLATWIL